MTAYLQKSFSVHLASNQEYRDNWDAIFAPEAARRAKSEDEPDEEPPVEQTSSEEPSLAPSLTLVPPLPIPDDVA